MIDNLFIFIAFFYSRIYSVCCKLLKQKMTQKEKNIKCGITIQTEKGAGKGSSS